VNHRVIIYFFTAMLLWSASWLVAAPSTQVANWTVRTQPVRLVNGGPVFFQVKPPSRLVSLDGSWQGHDLVFSFDDASRTWFALAGVPLDTKPGVYSMSLTGEGESHQQIEFTAKLNVAAGRYPKIKIGLSVDSKFTEPTPEQKIQIEAAQQIKKDYLNRVTAGRQWSGEFAAPVHATVSDVFGSQRIFNGKTSSPHMGLDFRVPSGTAVSAMNDGTVLLARPLYFEGNLVVLDHGQGLLTFYLHLSEFKVKEGDRVKRGEVVGLSGGTGRTTGPHLHAAVRWQGEYLDPAALLRVQLP
jgi:murein DD-endopeptidase MepM/ murein hydrolase activator NlpD